MRIKEEAEYSAREELKKMFGYHFDKDGKDKNNDLEEEDDEDDKTFMDAQDIANKNLKIKKKKIEAI